MLIKLRYPPQWFCNSDAKEICHKLKIKYYPTTQWVDYKTIPYQVHTFAKGFRPLILAQKNTLDVLEFLNYETILIHPDKLLTYLKKSAAKDFQLRIGSLRNRRS